MKHNWLITGSSRGFGWELAKAALDRGDNVVATARRPEQLASLVKSYGESVRTVALDVTDTASARTAVQAAVDAFGSLDVVVNNAGYANSAPIEEMSDDDFRAQIETNLFGVFNVTKAALPVLHKQRSGHFVQFSSIGGRVGGSPGFGCVPDCKVWRRRLFRGPQRRGEAAGHQSHHYRARWVPHRLGWLIHGNSAGGRGLRADGWRDEPLSRVHRCDLAR